jgi:hypothetical protein
MVDSEFVAVGAETQARLTDLGVMPKPGGEGERSSIIGVRASCTMIVTMAYEPWAMQSVAFARALPPKEKK